MNIAKNTPLTPFPQFLSLMDRYLILELITPFLFGMGLFTSLGLSIGILFDLVRKITESGLMIGVAFQVLILKMPEFIVLAFPMSMLLATLMAYSRLSGDSELIALRSIGISIYRLIIPTLILSLLVTSITFMFNNFIAPMANYQAAITLEKALSKEKPDFKENNIIYPEYKKIQRPDGTKETVLNRLFYAEQFDGRKMQGLTILDRSQEGVNQILTARSADWNIIENVWDFFDGTIYIIDTDGSYRNIVRFEHQKLAIPRAPLDLAKRGRDYGEMNIVQAQEYLQILRLSGDDQKVRKLKVRLHEKIALPFVCIVFGIIGAVIGLQPSHTNRATSFGICVVLIFAYYLLSFFSSSLGIWGILSPFMSAWLPNFFGLASGIYLLVKSAR
ncbi:LptF/LptG family permease [Gloeocapsa sp. PCC 73106]|uniref:LptF/LptG family permease n=1 Tax=Gloeocapsa sp. PCC 73106 TaxID=102232 RepID=UPI0002ACF4D2|nr:LptF/LptG family permease [Gloeocapsa sp. PCC 73106]ELR99818.1 putative permease [Gloeocapsa sp. PCC 73106]